MTSDEQQRRVIEIIAEVGDVPIASAQQLPADIMEDLKLDSLAVVEITLAIEEEFDIDVPDEEMNQLRTVGDVVACVKKHASGADRG